MAIVSSEPQINSQNSNNYDPQKHQTTLIMKATKSSWATHLGFNYKRAKRELGNELPNNYNSLLKRCVQGEVARLLTEAMDGEKSLQIDYGKSLAKFCDKDKYKAGVIEAASIAAKSIWPNNNKEECVKT